MPDRSPNHARLVDQAAVGLLEITFQGDIIMINPSGAALLGYTTEQLIGRNVLSITHPEDIPRTVETLGGVVQGQTEVGVVEKRYLRADGSIVWSRSRVSLFRDEHGHAHSCVAVVADITELKETQLRLQEAYTHLQATLEGGLLGLGLALEARDLETAGHTQRVVELSIGLGQALGLPESQLAELRHGAYLHDIGKLTILDSVLMKPGKLDAQEWALMQTHAVAGHEIASRIPTLSPGALQVIRHHHERWDGSGYPDRLAGAEIPLLARIFAVCDVYDALTGERSYKRAWTHQDAMAELLAQRGRQFDPLVVVAFTRIATGTKATKDRTDRPLAAGF
ncbi:hypothetical protein GCM10008955_37110 [Deinococcus malanensis]|uniref:PAS/PAC sensor protein n=1 Tax=Deinococcus malanensis TaxID=1706855 RepID=A0ABQ2F1C2_9DEIO|nr:hypothetical protein GCM10008955_37110 [Deinococcus malanensis]